MPADDSGKESLDAGSKLKSRIGKVPRKKVKNSSKTLKLRRLVMFFDCAEDVLIDIKVAPGKGLKGFELVFEKAQREL